uniref:CHAD domain-containing protein n=1 Tax=Sinocyclocheilus grahami TaxID=75366 RepID=A0A672PNQ5_SINGR
MKTEKVKHLRQTIQDTQEFIRSFSTGAPQRNDSLSELDLSLHERVRAQLRAALFDVHDIFFTTTPEERLSLLQQDRELRTERKLREMVAIRTDLRLGFIFIVQSHFHMNAQLCRSVFLSNTPSLPFYLACRKKQKAPRTR